MKISKDYYIENIDFNHYGSLNDYFVIACRAGDLDEVKRINDRFKPKLKSNNKFIRIAQNLLAKITDDYVYIDVHYYDDRCFRYASDNGHIDVIKYLLTSDELVEKCDIHAEKDYALRIACINNNVELVKYLLTSPDLKEHANIHAGNDEPLIDSYQNNRWDIVRYFIFELNIKITPEIETFIKHEKAYDLQSLFENRKLNKELLTEIIDKPIEKKKKVKL